MSKHDKSTVLPASHTYQRPPHLTRKVQTMPGVSSCNYNDNTIPDLHWGKRAVPDRSVALGLWRGGGKFLQLWAAMAMAVAMVLMGRRSGWYRCVIQNGEKLESECIMIRMVDLPFSAAENRVCPFGGFEQTRCWIWSRLPCRPCPVTSGRSVNQPTKGPTNQPTHQPTKQLITEWLNVLSGKRSKDWKTKSGASSVSRSSTLEGTLCL